MRGMKRSNGILTLDDKAFADLILMGYNKTEAYRRTFENNDKGRSTSSMDNRQCDGTEIKAYIEERKKV